MPVVTVIVDSPDRTRRWFEIVDELTQATGLVTNEAVAQGRAMATIIPFDDLRFSPTARLFEGGDHDVPVSVFITTYERGQGPQLHEHPYPEVFVVLTGTASFTVGDEQLTVERGHIVIGPAQTPHSFKCAGDDTLRVVSVHPSARVQQTDL